ncbi:MAG: signal peptidase I [Planctomycetes bacterium]|nr:signal peptidase I [Planctomycetota bacterium]
MIQRYKQRLAQYAHSGKLAKDVRFFAGVAVVYLILQATVVANVVVPTGSMLDTIREGERFLVWKLGYGLQNPFHPREKVEVGGKPLLKWCDVERGDIVMFVPPERSGKDEQYVKRVIGLPGDTVAVRAFDGVYVNGLRLDEPYIRQTPQYRFGPVVVPDGQLLVLGDNRNNSYDGHYWGFLPIESVQGVVALRYWPPWRAGTVN